MKADLDPSYVSLIESGKRTPSLEAINRIADALGIPFHLLALLAAAPSELRNIDPNTAHTLGETLLRLLMEHEE
jgi:transcriptional regulator with XRE-family HTH domain